MMGQMGQQWSPAPATTMDKGKGRATDAEFDAAFAQLDKSNQAVDDITAQLGEAKVDDDKEEQWKQYQRYARYYACEI